MTTKFEGANSSITTSKYLMNCGEKITNTNPTTSIWLNNLEALKKNYWLALRNE